MMKKICFVISSLSGGGAERVVLTLATELSKMGTEVHIILLRDKVQYEVERSLYSIHILSNIGRLSKIKFFSDLMMLKKLKVLLANLEEDKKFDLIVSNLVDADKLCAKINHSNIYFCIHNSESTKLVGKSILKKFKVQKRYSNKNLITVSNGLKNDLIKNLFIKPKKIVTIYNPFNFKDIQHSSQEYEIDINNYIIHIGRFTDQKRHDILLKAFKKSGIKQKLLLLGISDENSHEKIQELVNELNIEHNVKILGFIKNPYPYIKNAKALVLSSDYEGFGNVLVEAMVLNTMVVSTNCPSGPDEILRYKLVDFLSEPGDVNRLANNIRKAISNPIQITDEYINQFEAKAIATKYLSLCSDN